MNPMSVSTCFRTPGKAKQEASLNQVLVGIYSHNVCTERDSDGCWTAYFSHKTEGLGAWSGGLSPRIPW